MSHAKKYRVLFELNCKGLAYLSRNMAPVSFLRYVPMKLGFLALDTQDELLGVGFILISNLM